MSKKTFYLSICGLIAISGLVVSGCVGMSGPTLGIFSVPIPVSPYLQNGYEDKAWEHERYERVAILDPIIDGHAVSLDPPSDDMILRKLEKTRKTTGTVPFLDTTFRNKVDITREKIADYVDEPRFFPLVGPAQVHHVHYKCTVYFTEVTQVGWPIPHTMINEDASEVVYIDMDHLHRVGPEGDSPVH